ncbi:hypothetical protein NP233_g1184 [Leucocoprinus birnbaumii]|uniref:Cytochrome P450 n=1 Tax=Leucocoprinus birnbaumii TaxID=56174 RepID=A0AAD5W3E2_9AGAR|nr:hypothetical protein NP233_g1184 [Leucocoprinus birnbaumii]
MVQAQGLLASLGCLFPQTSPTTLALLLLGGFIWIFRRAQKRGSGIGELPLPVSHSTYIQCNILTFAKPGAEFLWGHERVVYSHEPGVSYRRWIRQLGLTFRIKAAFGARDVLVLSDRDGIHHILSKRIYDYPHSNVVRPRIARFLGKGLGWVEGASEHRRMKRIVAPSLTAENIRDMSSDIKDTLFKVIHDLESELKNSNEPHITANMLEWAGKMTLNAVGRVAFLLDLEGGKSEGATKILAAKAPHSRPATTFGGFLTLMLLRRFSFMNYLPIPALKAQASVREAINNGVMKEIVRRSHAMPIDGKDLLSRLLKADITPDELYAQISTFIISGHETTALTLAYSIYELSRHQDCQDKLRSELRDFYGEPTYDDLQTRLPYLDAVLKETLRLYPALPYMERTVVENDVIPLRQPVNSPEGHIMNSVHVKPGQTVIIPIIAIQRLDSVWKDPDTFRPERWLEQLPPSDDLPSGWSNLLAFSDGPRTCIGIRLAIYNYKTMISAMIQHFRFLDTGAQISLKISSAIQPWVIGKEDLGPHVPVYVEALE